MCNRKFSSVDEMNTAMVERWNAIVKSEDEVWVLGDFAWKGGENYFYRLNGKKHLVIGNHDNRSVITLPWSSQPQHYVELKKSDVHLILCHYPFEEWNSFFKNSIHLHGHVHGRKLNNIPRRIDVGVDFWDFTPVSLEQIIQHIKNDSTRPIVSK
jgi:calcineurin-like phosphoesterase family protein